MELTVVTLTQFNRSHLLDICAQSVRENLPAGAQHTFVRCDGDFQRVRWEATIHHANRKFVAWVDDDDVVCNDALRLCVRALQQTGAGVAFTHEVRIDEHGTEISRTTHHRTYRDVAMHPRSLHHLAVIRRECLDSQVYEHAERIGVGIDWLMRAWCALKHEAVQVPVIGYGWRKHPGATSQNPSWAEVYQAAIPALREVTTSWMTRNAPIPRLFPR